MTQRTTDVDRIVREICKTKRGRTTLELIHLTGIVDVRKRVSDARRAGSPIVSVPETTKTGKRVVRYRMAA